MPFAGMYIVVVMCSERVTSGLLDMGVGVGEKGSKEEEVHYDNDGTRARETSSKLDW